MATSLFPHQKSIFLPPLLRPDLPKTPKCLNKRPPVVPPSTRLVSDLKSSPPPRISSRASAEDLPTELIEDSKFVPLNSEDPKYGPPALLFLGFGVEEAAEIWKLLKELDGEFLEIIFCTEDMINCSLWEAVNTKQSNLEASKVVASIPRICFLSGLTGEEMMMFIDAFPETGLEPPIFAALVPNSADKPLAELIEEIMGDHEMLTAQKSG